jgi:hypothetical protein
MLGNYWVAERLVASEEEFCSFELFSGLLHFMAWVISLFDLKSNLIVAGSL